MRTIEQGHAAMITFCGVMDFPPPVAEKSFNIINKLQLCSKSLAEASMRSAALEEGTLTNSSDIIISGDGTWKTRGYFSRVGVCAVIGDKTGKCIDAEVMSSFYQQLASSKHPKHFQWGLDLENALAIRDVEYPSCLDNPEQRVFDDMLRCRP
ncbi:uncharacterized protein TNCV_668761 [Trichonephila clavipes]|nr:uncharacterized protein TNCV_668761 [Trichonephila clavipes]